MHFNANKDGFSKSCKYDEVDETLIKITYEYKK